MTYLPAKSSKNYLNRIGIGIIGILINLDASAAKPISVFNSSPIIAQIHQVSFPSTGQDLSQTYYAFNTIVSNYLSVGSGSNASYVIDGETLIVNQTIAGRVNKQTNIGITIPWIHHSAGVFDSAIFNFHDIFYLPQNGRKRDSNDRILWNVQADGHQVSLLQHSSQAQGDATLFVDHSESAHLSLRVEFNLPTGNIAKYTSDESLAVSTSYLYSVPLADQFEFWHGMGLTISDKIGQFNSLSQNSWVVAGVMGVSYTPLHTLSLNAQISGHTAYFNNDSVRELGWIPVILNLEAAYTIRPSDSVSLYIGEDLRPRTSPDFTLGFNYQHTF